jgi:DNA-binding MarR family transcriptional regulator
VTSGEPPESARMTPGEPSGSADMTRAERRHGEPLTPSEPGASPGFLLWHATLRWQRRIALALQPLHLTHVQFVLLASTWWLNRQGEHPNQVTIARHAGTDIKMTSEVLRSLERKGLLERTADRVDTRAKRVRTTPRGADLAPLAIAEVERADAEFFAPLSDRRRVLELLTALAGSDGASDPAG